MSDYNKRIRETYMTSKEQGERERLLSQNPIDFSKLGGVDKQKEKMLLYVKQPLEQYKYYEYIGIKPSSGILVHGPSGSGKTSFIHAAANACRLPIIHVKREDLIKKNQQEDPLSLLIKRAESLKPSLLYINELDTFCRKKEELESESEKLLLSKIIELLDTLPKEVILISEAINISEIDPSVRRSGRLDKEIQMNVPSEEEREEIIKKLLITVKHNNLDKKILSKITPGYVAADLKSLLTEAGGIAIKRVLSTQENSFSTSPQLHLLKIEQKDVEQALLSVEPSAMKEGFTIPQNISFSDIGALHEVKKVLELAIVQPSLHPERFLQVGIRKPAGVLLYGPPGTGKTMLARAIASKSHCNFISIKGPEVINMYHGESERTVRKLFARARASQPCVIFFDEIDSICGKRGGDSSRYSDTLVNQLLVEMDGLEERGAVYLIGATNRIDIIDKALLRPGRFDKLIEVLPPSPRDLLEIVTKKLEKVSTHPDVHLEDLPLEGLTGADVDLLVREAGLLSLEHTPSHILPRISQEFLLMALQNVKGRRR
ncbi:ribosome biogenesis ATPase [Nematocida sp. LUAm3]|nr:ribosome biogenesis ATPase [Nematocida sp. LUAm3]KAI5175162.1 ribosome biogenesis ATPase [Nematocida sp. LUAm2]KAI5178166.1 ribosome biogenesis ATPase [Nematocida sp. LUAm1]